MVTKRNISFNTLIQFWICSLSSSVKFTSWTTLQCPAVENMTGNENTMSFGTPYQPVNNNKSMHVHQVCNIVYHFHTYPFNLYQMSNTAHLHIYCTLCAHNWVSFLSTIQNYMQLPICDKLYWDIHKRWDISVVRPAMQRKCAIS